MTAPRRWSRTCRNFSPSRSPASSREATDETGLPLTLAGRGLRDALRLAGSPYSVWRDIVLTNSDNLERGARPHDPGPRASARATCATRELEEEFAAAEEVYKILRDLQ